MRDILLIFALLAAFASPAIAKNDLPTPGPGKGGPGGAPPPSAAGPGPNAGGKNAIENHGPAHGPPDPSNAAHNRASPSGPPDHAAKPAGKGNAGAAPGQTQAQPRKAQPAGPPQEQNKALDAVQKGEALPLARIVQIAEGLSGARVINARLLTVRNVLLYKLTMLNETGYSWRDYYYARTGNRVVLD